MSNGIQFDPAAIRALAQILKDTDLTEIELVEKDSRIRVARSAGRRCGAAADAAGRLRWPPPPRRPRSRRPRRRCRPRRAWMAKHPGLVTSPMVGVAYLSPEPGAAALRHARRQGRRRARPCC